MSGMYDDFDSVAHQVARGNHREVVGGLWEKLGRLQLDFLVSRGLAPHHRLLDLGCGCLRASVLLVDYLESGHYFGIDVNQPLLDAGRRELAAAGLEHKLPLGNLVCSGSFDLSAFAEAFDFALAQSLFTHLPLNSIRTCLERLPPAMKPGGLLFATYFERTRAWPEGHEITHPGGITTHSDRDPYHYTVADFAHLCAGLPWTLEPIGDWGHPRDQKMLAFSRA